MSRLFESFDQVQIINLPSRADRRAEMAEQLERIGSGLVDRNVSLFAAVRPEGQGDFPSIGAHGCFMSHLGILRDAAARGLGRVLILEDDLDFAPDFRDREGDVAAALAATDWGVFYGGYHLDEPLGQGPGAVYGLESDRRVKATHFIGFQGDSIPALVGFLEAMLERPSGHADGGPMHVDGAYSWYRRLHPGVRTLLANPELGHQRASRSDIFGLRWYDRSWLTRGAVAALRRRRRRRGGAAAQKGGTT